MWGHLEDARYGSGRWWVCPGSPGHHRNCSRVEEVAITRQIPNSNFANAKSTISESPNLMLTKDTRYTR